MTAPSKENIVKTYRFYAPLYDRLFGAVLEPGRTSMLSSVNDRQPSSVLEVGVGTGLTLARYPLKARIVGIDISDEMLEIAKTRAEAISGSNIELFRMDAENIEFADGSFECVVAPYVLSVTPNPDKLVAEIRRVCAKGGTIYILNHFSGSRFWWMLERAVSSLANKIGFRSTFSYEENILKYDWQVLRSTKVNLFGLSKLVEIKNT